MVSQLTKSLDDICICLGVIQNLELLDGHSVFLEQILALKLQEIQVTHGYLSIGR